MSKKLCLASLVLALGGCGSVQKLELAPIQPLEHSKRRLVAVLGFENMSGNRDHERLAEGLSGAMLKELGETQRFRLVDPAVEELKSALPGALDQGQAKKVGQKLGADAVLFGSLLSVSQRRKKPTLGIMWVDIRDTEVALDVQLVDVNTGEILALAKRSASVRQSKWVAFFIARIGTVSDDALQAQEAASIAVKQMANDLAVRAPSK